VFSVGYNGQGQLLPCFGEKRQEKATLHLLKKKTTNKQKTFQTMSDEL